MITLKELFFEPNDFSAIPIAPVKFEKGVNFIIGEKSDNNNEGIESEKMNGVGKSMLIEAINFCFLKELKNSRIDKIPVIDLNQDVYICLTFEVETDEEIKTITIKRTRTESKPIVVIEDGREVSYEKLSDVEKYLTGLLFGDRIENTPSLRNMLSILFREERTSYNDLLHPYGKSGMYNFSELLKPHLYLFHFDLAVVESIKKIYTNIEKADKRVQALKSDFKKVGIEPSEVKSYLNELEGLVDNLNLAVETLKPSEASKQKHDELNKILLELERLSEQKASKDYAIEKIKRLPKAEKIPLAQIRIIYNKYKEGLGDLVQKSFEQVLDFKGQIEEFQNTLMTEKLKSLQSENRAMQERIDILDEQASKIYESANAKGKINDLSDAIKLQKEKGDKYELMKSDYSSLETTDTLRKKLKKDKNELLEKLEVTIFEFSRELNEFESDLVEMHDFIEGNKNCSFTPKVIDDKKEYFQFDYRIKHDGSSGINRIKTFMYDCLLMLNRFTAQRHPGFLIHDNIFASTGRDDMVRALNYLASQEEKGKKFQYIVTINRDELDGHLKEFTFDFQSKVRKELTREHPFLEAVYSEIG